MITKKDHQKLITKWSKYGKVYMTRNKRVIQRLKWFDKQAPLLKGLNVLEIGCNAGLFMVEADKHVKGYIGLEPKEVYFKQAQKTKDYFDLRKSIVSPMSFKNFFQESFRVDGLILSRVMYWLSENEVNQLQVMLQKIKVAIVICGKQKKNGIRNSYDFHIEANVEKFFKDTGMSWEKTLDHERLFGGVAKRY